MDKETWDLVRLGLEGFGAVIMTAFGFIVNSVRGTLRDLREDHAATRVELSDLRIQLPDKYVQKSDFTEVLREVRGSINDIREMLIKVLHDRNAG